MSGYGSGPYGSMPYGDGFGFSATALALLDVQAMRENVFRLEFNEVMQFTELADQYDGSQIIHYAIAVVPGSADRDGVPTRAVTPVRVVQTPRSLLDDPATFGRFIDLVVDRPMSSYPALYAITVNDLYAVGISAPLVGYTTSAYAAYRMMAPPMLDALVASRDVANPQTLSAFYDPLPQPSAALLGTFVVDDQGDYAHDEGIVSLRKRIIRRLLTRKGGFVHLPEYGVGVPQIAKKLNTAAVRSTIARDAEAQIKREPEVSRCVCRVVTDPDTPGLVRFRVLVRTFTGQTTKFDVPFAAV